MMLDSKLSTTLTTLVSSRGLILSGDYGQQTRYHTHTSSVGWSSH